MRDTGSGIAFPADGWIKLNSYEAGAATWAGGLDVYVYFNNDQRGAAPRDAAGIAAAISDLGSRLAGAVTGAGA